jgi:hypothetical protein
MDLDPLQAATAAANELAPEVTVLLGTNPRELRSSLNGAGPHFNGGPARPGAE